MASYYYLISSLPELSANEEMPITYDEFIAMCEDNVSDKTLERLKNLTLDSAEGPLLKKWSGFYTGLFRELNAQRSAALGKSYQAEYEKDPESTGCNHRQKSAGSREASSGTPVRSVGLLHRRSLF